PRSINSGGPAWAGPAMTATRAAAAQRPVVPPAARMADITASLAQRPPAGPSIGLLRGRGFHGPRPPTTAIALLARAQIVPQILQMAHDPDVAAKGRHHHARLQRSASRDRLCKDLEGAPFRAPQQAG